MGFEAVEGLFDEIDEVDTGSPNAELYARIADVEVTVVGSSDDSLAEVEEVFERQFAKTVDTYVENRDKGEFR